MAAALGAEVAAGGPVTAAAGAVAVGVVAVGAAAARVAPPAQDGTRTARTRGARRRRLTCSECHAGNPSYRLVVRLTRALVLPLLLVAACTSGTPKPQPTASTPGIGGVQAYPGLSHVHLQKGQYPHAYPQSPPVGGPHSPVWLKCTVYAGPLPNENAVHSEEHGGIWLTYQPALAPADVAKLALLAQVNREFVMVSPYAGQDAPVVASTWGLQLKVQSAGDPRLLEFIRTYAGGNQGGEKGVGCASTGATLPQALAFDASQT